MLGKKTNGALASHDSSIDVVTDCTSGKKISRRIANSISAILQLLSNSVSARQVVERWDCEVSVGTVDVQSGVLGTMGTNTSSWTTFGQETDKQNEISVETVHNARLSHHRISEVTSH